MSVPDIIIVGIISFSLFSCKPQEIILHGEITGLVTDATTNLPIQAVTIKLNTTNDTTSTGNDGSFLFKNLSPGEYEIKATKYGYDSIKQNIEVVSAETKQIAFTLNGIPVPSPSVTFLDFGLDSTSLRFSISNLGKGKFAYFLTPSQDWITLSPSNGNITNETAIINVTINKTGLSENIYNETITIFSFANLVPLTEFILPVTLNGVRDHDGNYYKVVRIGTQIWMAENLNVGTNIPLGKNASNNGTIERYCYSDSKNNCDIYGGLYQWDEMMQYNSADTGLIGTNQGICPVGWHIPTHTEWLTLAENVGGVEVAGPYLKEAGFSHWLAPNLGATNESGFTALPGGLYAYDGYLGLGEGGAWWSSTEYYLKFSAYSHGLGYNDKLFGYGINPKVFGYSVRCVKNPGKQ